MEKVGRPRKRTAQAVVKDIRRQTRRKFNSEEKIRIVLEGLKGEESISEICRKEGIAPALYYRGAGTLLKQKVLLLKNLFLLKQEQIIHRVVL